MKTPSHTATIFTDEDTTVIVKFHYKAPFTPYAPFFSPNDIDEELEILEAFEESEGKTFILDENDPELEKLLNEHEHLWQEIELEDWH